MSGKKKIAAKKQEVNLPVNKRKYFLLQKILLFVIAFALYANSIDNGFNMDDEYYTTPSNKVSNSSLSAIPGIFTTRTMRDEQNIYEYRPIPMLSFLLQHQFINSNAETSHLVNVMLYAITCVLIFLLLCRWFPGSDNWFSFFICLLFILHPLHTEVVDSIKSRDELLSLFFTMLSLLMAWKWHETRKKGYLIFYPVLFFLALLSKITVMPYIVLSPLTLYFFGGVSLKKTIYYSLPLLACSIAYFCIQHFLPPNIRVFTKDENPLLLPGITFSVKSATSIYVLGKYLLLHFWPYPLLFFYGYKYIPLVGWNNIWAITSLALYVGITIFIVKNFRKRSIIVFAALFYLLAILPFSNFIWPVPGLVGERYTYSSSLAFCIMICYCLSLLFKLNISEFKLNMRTRNFSVIIIAIGIIYAYTTFARNSEWQDKHTLYSHDIKYLQKSVKVNMLYSALMITGGIQYQKRASGNAEYADSAAYCFSEAKTSLQQAINIIPEYGKAYNNLAIVYYKQDSVFQAKIWFLKALQYAPNDLEISYNLGRTYIYLGKTDSGLLQYSNVLRKDSAYAPVYKDLSEALLRKGDTSAAINILSSAIRKIPDEQYSYTTLAMILLGRGDILTAVPYCEKAAELPPANINVYNFLKKYYEGRHDTAKTGYYQQKINQYYAR